MGCVSHEVGPTGRAGGHDPLSLPAWTPAGADGLSTTRSAVSAATAGQRSSTAAATGCSFDVSGLIGDRWRALNAQTGPLGCPTDAQHAVSGRNGLKQAFEHGEIASSPDQGQSMVVSAYLVNGDAARRRRTSTM
jgi:uncharacterized protein with LGFP repeats